MDARGIALFSIGNETVGLLARVAPQTSSGGMRVWLEVADARAAATVLSGRGLSPLRDPFETATGWTVEVSDPWGNVVGLTDYTLRPERGRSGRERREPAGLPEDRHGRCRQRSSDACCR